SKRMNMTQLPFNGFDVMLVLILAAGLVKGRKAGMSGELLSLTKWLTIVFVCAMAYEPVGSFFNQETSIFSMLSCYLMAYVGAALFVVLIFMGIQRGLHGKLLGSDVFGRAEYYLGMGSGLIRFACILIAFLALLNARYFTPKEVQAEERFQNDVYGSDFFPTLHTVQSTVFEKSLTGPWIKEHLGFLLIKPTEDQSKSLRRGQAAWQ
ncbi:MAG TPA: CvpA family protein, partial [Verrucomicrobiae bacterium]|nr:CvpA family protein [Verrucomicrobiae bacterium]